MVIADHELKEMMRAQHLTIGGYDEHSLEPATYDMRVGTQAFIISSEGPEQVNLEERRILLIGASDLAIVGTHETLEMPRDVVGHFGLRSGLSRRGLYASVGPQIDPGFRGRLFVTLFNLTPSPIPLSYLDKFLTVEFQKLAGPVDRPYDGDYQDKFELRAEDIEPFLNFKAPSLAKIHKEFGEMAGNLRAVATLGSKFDEFIKASEVEREKFTETMTALTGEIKKLVAFIVEGGRKPRTLVLRSISRRQAKKEILDLFKTSSETLYYSDIAEKLKLDLGVVVEICNELEKGKLIGAPHEKKNP